MSQAAVASLAAGAMAAPAGAAVRRERGHLAAVVALISDWRRKDIDGVLARVTDDVVWYSHVGSPPVLGKPAMRQVLTTLAAGMNDIRWRVVNHARQGASLLVEGVDEFATPQGQRVALPYMGIMVFRGRLVAEWRDYFDRALFDRLKAGEASPAHINALTAKPGLP